MERRLHRSIEEAEPQDREQGSHTVPPTAVAQDLAPGDRLE
jgi:hypothetical protein